MRRPSSRASSTFFANSGCSARHRYRVTRLMPIFSHPIWRIGVLRSCSSRAAFEASDFFMFYSLLSGELLKPANDEIYKDWFTFDQVCRSLQLLACDQKAP